MDKKVLLYSGGMDSWLIDKLWKPDIKLFVRIHTPSNDVEYNKLCKQLENKHIDGSNLKILDYDLSMFELPSMNYYMPLRNLHLVLLAAHYGNRICIGSVRGSVHLDNNATFAKKTEDLIDYLLSEKQLGIVNVELPYVNTSKTELLRMYIQQGGDINVAYKNTLSCYHPINGEECMMCTSCASKFTAFYNNGYKFTQQQIDKFIKFVGENTHINEDDVVILYNKLKNA